MSLAIDTKERDAAAAALRSYLASVVLKDSTSRKLPLRTPKKGQTAPVQLSKAQYMAGAQLYALEVRLRPININCMMLPCQGPVSPVCFSNRVCTVTWEAAILQLPEDASYLCGRCLQKGLMRPHRLHAGSSKMPTCWKSHKRRYVVVSGPAMQVYLAHYAVFQSRESLRLCLVSIASCHDADTTSVALQPIC